MVVVIVGVVITGVWTLGVDMDMVVDMVMVTDMVSDMAGVMAGDGVTPIGEVILDITRLTILVTTLHIILDIMRDPPMAKDMRTTPEELTVVMAG